MHHFVLLTGAGLDNGAEDFGGCLEYLAQGLRLPIPVGRTSNARNDQNGTDSPQVPECCWESWWQEPIPEALRCRNPSRRNS